MSEVEVRRSGDIAYREVAPASETGAPVVCLHGYPESSRMWTAVMEALAARGRRAIAPDLYGLGDSRSDGPQTFEASLEAFTRFADDIGLGRAAVCVHDWGGFVGLGVRPPRCGRGAGDLGHGLFRRRPLARDGRSGALGAG